ncbi:MAG TPA: thioredoxin family protein [Candidatus Deferrimicrobiaceae bacterium]|nr:thioredoxin family protein [Candidatus Deferrimicrobiaceae bacterium]
MGQGNPILEINETDFDQEVAGADLPVLVDFFTPPCAPCKALLPVLGRVAGKHPDLKIVKVNAWDNPGLCSRFKIVGVPALLFFRNGEPVRRIDGFDDSTERRIEDALTEMAAG